MYYNQEVYTSKKNKKGIEDMLIILCFKKYIEVQ